MDTNYILMVVGAIFLILGFLYFFCTSVFRSLINGAKISMPKINVHVGNGQVIEAFTETGNTVEADFNNLGELQELRVNPNVTINTVIPQDNIINQQSQRYDKTINDPVIGMYQKGMQNALMMDIGAKNQVMFNLGYNFDDYEDDTSTQEISGPARVKSNVSVSDIEDYTGDPLSIESF